MIDIIAGVITPHALSIVWIKLLAMLQDPSIRDLRSEGKPEWKIETQWGLMLPPFPEREKGKGKRESAARSKNLKLRTVTYKHRAGRWRLKIVPCTKPQPTRSSCGDPWRRDWLVDAMRYLWWRASSEDLSCSLCLSPAARSIADRARNYYFAESIQAGHHFRGRRDRELIDSLIAYVVTIIHCSPSRLVPRRGSVRRNRKQLLYSRHCTGKGCFFGC